MTRWRPLLLLVPLLCLAGRSEAITISLSPSPVSTTPGQTFTLDLVVSGLAGGTLGSWEVDVLFDDALLSLDAVTFGVDLDGGTGDSLQDALPIGAGVWNLAELSLLSPNELDDQEDSFVLATLEFSALVEGTGAVTLANADAGDGIGEPFPELGLESAQIQVVPEPGTGSSWRARSSRSRLALGAPLSGGVSPPTPAAAARDAVDVVHRQLALGHPGFEADGARFVRDPRYPRIYDANFVWGVRAATGDALERLFARVEREFAGVGHRAFRLDPRTPPELAARLALDGYERQDSLVMLLEGEPAGAGVGETPGAAAGPARGTPCEIGLSSDEEDWAALLALKRDDFAETFRRREPGKPVDLAIGDHLAGANRAKCPPQRYWLARVDGAPCGFLASWEGVGGVGQVEDLFVAPPFRRRGIARALLLHGVADARACGAGPVAIVADPTDTPMRLYAALGFRPLAVCALYRKLL